MMLVIAVQVIAIGVLTLLIPTLSRQTTPLGVSIPSGYTGHPVVTSAVRIYRLFSAGAAGIVLAVLLVLPPDNADVAFVVAPLGVLASSSLAYVWQRRRIVAAKTSEGWYAGRAVGVSARLTPEPRRQRPAPVWPFVIGAVCVVSTIAFGVSSYGSIPDPYPAHTGLFGVPDRWAPKTPVEVFFSPVMAAAILLLVGGVSWWLPRRPERGLADGDADTAAARRAVHVHTTRVVLSWIALVEGVGTGALAVLTWTGRWGAPLATALGLMLIAAMVAVLVPILRAVPVLREIDALMRPGLDRESPDDDRYWKFGLVYINRDDPAILVPYRAGLGMTLNMGHPVGMAVMIGAVLLLIWSIVQGG